MVPETVFLGSESTGSFLFLNPLPRKEMRGRAAHFFTKDVLHFNCGTPAHSLFTSEAMMAYRALLLNFLFQLLTKGHKVDTSAHFQETQSPPTLPSTLCTQECIQRNAPEISSFRTDQPKRNSRISQLTVHTHSSSSSRGRLKQFRKSHF